MRPLPILLLTVGYFAVAVASYSQVAAEDSPTEAARPQPCTSMAAIETAPNDRSGSGDPVSARAATGVGDSIAGRGDCTTTAAR